ncbi:HlyD family efflux transporter periplasmic adaptor subunit [Breoghania sp.]|uniref:HlyD family secretion protein n=1 Tax=Breoghania sp. TaxID=2065378 RepID=UPI0026052CB4|nr:HlyD family efflux transporter periplasmic adaptor subunit [Breoghania sp.]MDJ0933282.1 hypothetical protein [Breoghania sp.]
MRRLRSRERVDTHVNKRRTNKRSLGRWVYLGILAAIGVGILNYVWGDMVLLRPPGLVLQERIDVEAEYIGRLDEMPLRIGQSVHRGEVLGIVSSVEISERLAVLSLRIAELTREAPDKQEEMRIARDLLPIARARLTEAKAVKQNIDQLSKKGLAPADRVPEALTENNSAHEMMIRLEAQIAGHPASEKALQPALDQVRRAYANLARLYDDGVLRAPVNGTIDSELPAQGNLFLTGEKILSLYTGPHYVLAYLPSHHLFPVKVGEAVVLDSSQETLSGRVVEVLPVTDTLPAEFQNTFQSAERNQLARITIEDGRNFPLHTKVRVSRRNRTAAGIFALMKGTRHFAANLFHTRAEAEEKTRKIKSEASWRTPTHSAS